MFVVAAGIVTAVASAAPTTGPLNPGAEVGACGAGGNLDIPNWSDSLATQICYGAPGHMHGGHIGPADRGFAFFAGGPTGTDQGALSTCIDLTNFHLHHNHPTYTVSIWGGGRGAQNDSATTDVVFWSNSTCGGGGLGGVVLPFVRAVDRGGVTGLRLRSFTGEVPAGANSADLQLRFDRVTGAYNNGYADNVWFTAGH
jgi:hypothetical protein